MLKQEGYELLGAAFEVQNARLWNVIERVSRSNY